MLLLILKKPISTKRLWQTPTKYHIGTTAKINPKKFTLKRKKILKMLDATANILLEYIDN